MNLSISSCFCTYLNAGQSLGEWDNLVPRSDEVWTMVPQTRACGCKGAC